MFLLYNNDYEKYQESRLNRGAMVFIPNELKNFRSQNTKYSKNYMKSQKSVKLPHPKFTYFQNYLNFSLFWGWDF